MKRSLKLKETRYTIEWDKDISDCFYLYKTFEQAEKKRLYISPNEGRILRVTIEEL